MFFLTGICAKVVVKNRDGRRHAARDTHPLGSVTLTHPAPLPPSSATVATLATPRSVEAHVYKGPVRLQPWCGSNAVSHSSRHHLNLSRERIRGGSADNCRVRPPEGQGLSSRPPRRARARVLFAQWGTTTTDNSISDLPCERALDYETNQQRGPLTVIEIESSEEEPRSRWVSKYSELFRASSRSPSAVNIFILFDDKWWIINRRQ